MPAGVAARAFKWIVERYKSVPFIVLRTTVATLLGTADLASDVQTIVSLFGLGIASSAYALLAMVCSSIAAQVGARTDARLRGCAVAPPRGAHVLAAERD